MIIEGVVCQAPDGGILLKNTGKEVVLRVQDPEPSHVGRNIVTLDKKSKERLGITSGDIVEVDGTKKTAAIVWPSRQEDEGRGIIRMDNLIRHNSGVGLGEKVYVRRAKYGEAKKIVLAPTQEVRIIASGYDRILKKNFIGRPITKGDNVWISVFGSGFVYSVVDTMPHGIVRVTDFTQFVLKEKPVKEAVEGAPRIAYEDIGGLDEQVRKVREMIELPMRHPELFRRLGITPPKGVLLFGPPGTGKTLLAKAVANETQAHFIAVNAPALMCMGPETLVQTNPSGPVQLDALFQKAKAEGKTINKGALEIVELENPTSVFSLNKNLKVVKGEITHVTKLRAKSHRVSTAMGDSFVVSSNHPFGTLNNAGEIVWKTVKGLKKGEYVAVARQLPEGKQQHFDWRQDFDVDNTFVLSGDKEIKLSTYQGETPPVMKVKSARIKSNQDRATYVNLHSQTSPDLMRFLGLLYSEGTLFNDSFQFCNKERVLLDEFIGLAKQLFGLEYYKEYSRDDGVSKAVFYSSTLSKYLNITLGFPIGRKAGYSLPSWMFKCTKVEISEFIGGFWDGDGTVSKGIGDYPTMRIYASNKKVLFDLAVLFKSLGILSKVVPWKTKLSDMFALVVIGNRSRELFAEKIKSNTKKYRLISDWYSRRKKKGDDLPLPDISRLLKKIKEENNLSYNTHIPEGATERYISGRDPLTFRKLDEIMGYFERHSCDVSRLKALSNSDVSWTRIEAIEEAEETDLYDLTVEPYNNFFAGKTMTLVHNSKFVGEAEERIRQVFKEAEDNAPSIIFFDEIDAIAPKRDEVIGEVERRVVAQLLASMDGMEARGNVIVIAATNRVNSLDEALRRPGRFDREIEIGVPDKKGRNAILQIHTRGMPLSKDVDMDYFAGITHGFVGADLAALGKESAMKALRRYLPKINLEEESIPQEVLESLEVNRKDFMSGLRDVQPSALREVTIEVPNIRWSDVGGLKKVKSELKQAVEWPLKNPEAFKKMGITAPRGILLYGPPGCGKTLLAKAVATESEANFISVKGPELISKWVGESERGIRQVFRRARQVSPVIIFFDEVDSIAARRGSGLGDSGATERVINQLLTELDGVEDLKDVVFVAATNRPDLVDPGLLRPGRVDKVILVPAPDLEAREAILKVHLKGVFLSKDVSVRPLAEKTEGYSGADLDGLVREAALLSLQKNKMKPTPIEEKDFDEAMKKIFPSINKDVSQAYDAFRKIAKTPFKPSYVG